MEFLIFSIIIAALLVVVAPRFIPPQLSVLHQVTKAAALLLILFAVASTSFVYIDADKAGHVNKIYGSNLPQGAYIAINGEKGPQAAEQAGANVFGALKAGLILADEQQDAAHGKSGIDQEKTT